MPNRKLLKILILTTASLTINAASLHLVAGDLIHLKVNNYFKHVPIKLSLLLKVKTASQQILIPPFPLKKGIIYLRVDLYNVFLNRSGLWRGNIEKVTAFAHGLMQVICR